ncbi:hypothetical protein XFF6166_990002 [Xanthomonas citri pv. fuscans]|nr:hypothetical protein XFF6166_990002 [Xanthomonas citri pv. fuscans]
MRRGASTGSGTGRNVWRAICRAWSRIAVCKSCAFADGRRAELASDALIYRHAGHWARFADPQRTADARPASPLLDVATHGECH